MANIRICYVVVEGSKLLRVTDRGVKFTGPSAPLFHPMANDVLWYKQRFNATLIPYDSFGVREPDGSFSGCLGSMVRNETDVSPGAVGYPYFVDYEVIEPVVLLMDSITQILSSYNGTEGIVRVDVLKSSVIKHSPLLWIGLMALIILSFLVFKLCQRIERERTRLGQERPQTRYLLYDTLTHLFNFISNDFDDVTRRILCFFLVLASFLVYNYFSNYMTTDLVVAKKPDVIRTYDDIIKRKDKLQVLILETMTDLLEFREADQSSIKKKLWDIFSDPHHLRRFGQKSIAFSPSKLERIVGTLLAGARGEVLLLISDLFVKVVLFNVCRMKAGFEAYQNVHPFVSTDPHSDSRPRAILVRHEWMVEAAKRNDPIYQNLKRNAIRLIEGGIGIAALQQVTDKLVMGQNIGEIDTTKFAACMRYEHLQMPEVGFEKMVPYNLGGLFICALLIIAFSFTVLLSEHAYQFLVHPRRQVGNRVSCARRDFNARMHQRPYSV